MTSEITLLKNLGITKAGTYSEDGSYVIDLDNDIEFSKIYTILDKNDSLDFMEDDSDLTLLSADFNYLYNDEFELNLTADFEKDEYQLIITKID